MSQKSCEATHKISPCLLHLPHVGYPPDGVAEDEDGHNDEADLGEEHVTRMIQQSIGLCTSTTSDPYRFYLKEFCKQMYLQPAIDLDVEDEQDDDGEEAKDDQVHVCEIHL